MRTVERRMADPRFRRTLEEASGALVATIVRRLAALSTTAVDTLEDLLRPEVSPAVRQRAAKSIIELGARLRVEIDQEERIEALEAILQSTVPEARSA